MPTAKQTGHVKRDICYISIHTVPENITLYTSNFSFLICSNTSCYYNSRCRVENRKTMVNRALQKECVITDLSMVISRSTEVHTHWSCQSFPEVRLKESIKLSPDPYALLTVCTITSKVASSSRMPANWDHSLIETFHQD